MIRKMMLVVVLLACVALISVNGKAHAQTVADGKTVTFEYTLSVDGNVVDSSDNTGPVQYVHGRGGIVQGLSQRMTGMKAGEQKTFVIPPEEGYGLANPNMFKEMPRDKFPEDMDLRIGRLLELFDENGKRFAGSITEVKDDTILMDLNHPLAGKTLNFDVTINDVKDTVTVVGDLQAK